MFVLCPRWQAKSTKRTDGEQSELVRDNLRRALRPLSPEAVLVLGFPGMLIKTKDTLVSGVPGFVLPFLAIFVPRPWQPAG